MQYLLIVVFVIYIVLHILKAKWQAFLVGLLLYGSIIKDTIIQSQTATFLEKALLILLSFWIFMFFNTIIDILSGD